MHSKTAILVIKLIWQDQFQMTSVIKERAHFQARNMPKVSEMQSGQ